MTRGEEGGCVGGRVCVGVKTSAESGFWAGDTRSCKINDRTDLEFGRILKDDGADTPNRGLASRVKTKCVEGGRKYVLSVAGKGGGTITSRALSNDVTALLLLTCLYTTSMKVAEHREQHWSKSVGGGVRASPHYWCTHTFRFGRIKRSSG